MTKTVYPFLLLILSYPILGQTSGTLTVVEDSILTEDHLGDIIIETDGVILDCNGHTVMGPSPGPDNFGISIKSSEVTVKNCHATNFSVGVFVYESNNNLLQGNTANHNTGAGFIVRVSHDNVIVNNTADGNGGGFFLSGSAHTVTGNTASHNRGAGFLVERGLRGVANTLTNNVSNNNNTGFSLHAVSNITLTGNIANNNRQDGFALLEPRKKNTLKNNSAGSNGRDGFRLYEGLENLYADNKACDNGRFDAIQSEDGVENIFIDNQFCTTSGF
jgi:parallel beta-helix repeat protein